MMRKIQSDHFYDQYLSAEHIRWVGVEDRDESGEYDVIVCLAGVDRDFRMTCDGREEAEALAAEIVSFVR